MAHRIIEFEKYIGFGAFLIPKVWYEIVVSCNNFKDLSKIFNLLKNNNYIAKNHFNLS